MYTVQILKHRQFISEKERRRNRLVTNCSDIPSKDNQYCRISEHKIQRRPMYKCYYKPRKAMNQI
jgi:hypothetical protein